MSDERSDAFAAAKFVLRGPVLKIGLALLWITYGPGNGDDFARDLYGRAAQFPKTPEVSAYWTNLRILDTASKRVPLGGSVRPRGVDKEIRLVPGGDGLKRGIRRKAETTYCDGDARMQPSSDNGNALWAGPALQEAAQVVATVIEVAPRRTSQEATPSEVTEPVSCIGCTAKRTKRTSARPAKDSMRVSGTQARTD